MGDFLLNVLLGLLVLAVLAVAVCGLLYILLCFYKSIRSVIHEIKADMRYNPIFNKKGERT